MSDKPVLWDKDSDPVQRVRLPKSLQISTSNSSAEQSTDISLDVNNSTVKPSTEPIQQNHKVNLEELVANSTLNAAANAWYPKNAEKPVSNIQNRLKAHKTQSEVVAENNVNNEYINNEYINNENSPDLNRIKQIISTLTKDPGQFHNLLDIFMETLIPYLKNIFAPSLVADIIVQQAINHPNFRYTGARLCWLIEPYSPEFRAELHLKCKKQIEENPDSKNVLPLIAELYIQLPSVIVYGNLLIFAFKKLVDIGGNDNIKCICQALKLTGYHLEQTNKLDLDKVFTDLKLCRGRVEGSALILLESVFQLRSSNWGHSSDESSDAETNSEQDNDLAFEALQNKVIYDIDGEALTSEESEFIAAHMTANDEFDIDDFDPDELCDPEPEMDEEIQEAFKEFIRLSGKH